MIDSSQNDNVPKRRPNQPVMWVLAGMVTIGLLLWLAVMIKTGVGFFAPKSNEASESQLLDFTVKEISGSPVSLSSLRGKTVLVNFWATWCTPCKEEMPLLQSYYDAHKEDGFILVGVNVSDDVEDAEAFIRQYGYTFPVWSDPAGNVLIDLNMNGLPTSLVVDAKGNVIKRWIGPLTQEDLDGVITPLLESQK